MESDRRENLIQDDRAIRKAGAHHNEDRERVDTTYVLFEAKSFWQ